MSVYVMHLPVHLVFFLCMRMEAKADVGRLPLSLRTFPTEAGSLSGAQNSSLAVCLLQGFLRLLRAGITGRPTSLAPNAF